MKLKALREQSGMTQVELAQAIKNHGSVISLYENDTQLPELEDAVIMERIFKQKIDWFETLSPNRKHQTIQGIIELCQKYPLPMVAEFVARLYRRNEAPETLIIHYSKAITGEIEPLLPAGITGKCKDCNT